MILSSQELEGDSPMRTGISLSEFAAAYYVFLDAGADLTLASPAGGHPPIDPNDDRVSSQSEAVKRFKADRDARTVLADTVRLDQVAPEDFQAVFYVGGSGPMWDLAEDRESQRLITDIHSAKRPIAFLSHAPAALCSVADRMGRPLVAGRRLTASANTEDAAAGMSARLPFSLEDELVRLGARYSKAADWTPHVVRDGILITGQNARSAGDTARAVLELLAHSR